MYPLYQELREALGAPRWIDRNGVPRYLDFHPGAAAEIYCDWVALMDVECQSCGKRFLCANAIDHCQVAVEFLRRGEDLPPNTTSVMIPVVAHWGDAPWHDWHGDPCGFESQCPGTTMTTEFHNLRVWHRNRDHSKHNEFEGWDEISEPHLYLEQREPDA